MRTRSQVRPVALKVFDLAREFHGILVDTFNYEGVERDIAVGRADNKERYAHEQQSADVFS
jgi:hypothetical protein